MNEENIEPEIFSTDSDPGTPNAMKAIGSIVAHPKRVRGGFCSSSRAFGSLEVPSSERTSVVGLSDCDQIGTFPCGERVGVNISCVPASKLHVWCGVVPAVSEMDE